MKYQKNTTKQFRDSCKLLKKDIYMYIYIYIYIYIYMYIYISSGKKTKNY